MLHECFQIQIKTGIYEEGVRVPLLRDFTQKSSYTIFFSLENSAKSFFCRYFARCFVRLDNLVLSIGLIM